MPPKNALKTDPSELRLQIKLPSAADRFLLRMWASLTGRQVGNLAVFLLEKGLRQALQEGQVPAPVLRIWDSWIANGRFDPEYVDPTD